MSRYFSTLIFSISLLAILASSAYGSTLCSEDGERVGSRSATQFCRVLESPCSGASTSCPAEEDHVTEICEEASAFACRAKLDEILTDNTHCGELVRSNWNYSRTTFETFKSQACPYPRQDVPAVLCPSGTIRTHRDRFCFNGNDYVAFINSRWLTFIDNIATDDGTRLYSFESDDNGPKLFRFGELTPVKWFGVEN